MTAPRVDWDLIDTVLLDLDGTLLDLAFDNYLWLSRIPAIFGEKNALSQAETYAQLAPRFTAVQGTLQWYSIDYWSEQLDIDIAAVHREEVARVAWLPGAQNFLVAMRTKGKRIALMTNSHPVILQIKHAHTGVLDYLDAAYTSHGFNAPKENQGFWKAAVAKEKYNPERTLFIDDSKNVLQTAIDSGIRWVFAVRFPDTSAQPHSHEEFLAIDTLTDLTNPS